MSAYGALLSPTLSAPPLPSTIWKIATRPGPSSTEPHTTLSAPKSPAHITIHHLTLPTARTLSGLLEHLHEAFAYEVDRGLTYPQETLQGETLARDAFEGYFFAADVFVGIVGSDKVKVAGKEDGEVSGIEVDEARDGRSWEECIAGFYYVKPNYPGRSSHICNAGFVVPPAQRGGGYGSILAKSYLHYGPKLGYQASVFNLVYVNNTASVKIWERLNFTKAGLIPRAGRLKRGDGQGEEYIDAWVFYKSFAEP